MTIRSPLSIQHAFQDDPEVLSILRDKEVLDVLKKMEGTIPVKGIELLKGEKGDQGEQGLNGVDGEDGLDGTDGKDGKDGQDGENGRDGKDGRNGVDGKDGTNGVDGFVPTFEEILNTITGLKGKNADKFAKALGAMIDISYIRNANSFMFQGKRYKIEELMHGGGSSSSGSTLTPETPVGTVDGSNLIFTVTHDPVQLFSDGLYRVVNVDYTYLAPTITMNALIPPVQSIISYYSA